MGAGPFAQASDMQRLSHILCEWLVPVMQKDETKNEPLATMMLDDR